MRTRSLSHLGPQALLRHLADVLARERGITAELILCLAEVFRRRLHVAEGYPSMHAYCVRGLGLSEDSAGKRIRVVREARRFPEILDMIAEGRLHLSAVCLLAPHLTRENAAELFAAAEHRSKREIERWLAERFPQSDVAALVQPLGSAPGPAQKSVPGRIEAADPAAAGQVATVLDPVERSAEKSVPGRIERPDLEADPAATPATLPATPQPAPYPRVTSLAPQRYAVQFTMDERMHADLTRAQELLGRCATGEIAEVFGRALRELVASLEKRRLGACSKPRVERAADSGAASRGRHISEACESPPCHPAERARVSG